MGYEAPGVYIRYVTDGPLTIRAASTSTPVFIGPTVIGQTGVGVAVSAVMIESAADYIARFTTKGCNFGPVSLPSSATPASNTTTPSGDNLTLTDPMGHAVRGFFLNGGSKAYVVSTCDTDANTAAATIALKNGDKTFRYKVTAVSAGKWGNDIEVITKKSSLGAGFCDLDIKLHINGEDEAGNPKAVAHVERFVGLDIAKIFDSTTRTSIVSSTLVTFDAANSGGTALDTAAGTANPITTKLTGGQNASAPASVDYGSIFTALRDIDDISLIVLPGCIWPEDKAAYEAAISHAQACKDRMVLIQLEDETSNFATVNVPQDKYASVYYPAADITMKTPGAGVKTARRVALTGHVAGIFARTDADKGPWTAPAGLHASIAGITRLTKNISQTRQESINKANINALRYIENMPVIWGARTRDKDGLYEYVPVMRTAFLIADSLRSTLNKVVFAKNTEVLWRNVKTSVNSFMTDLYNRNAFQGATPSQAFQIRCGLGESMSQSEIDGGLLRVVARFKPAKPAEFIEVSIEQILEGAA